MRVVSRGVYGGGVVGLRCVGLVCVGRWCGWLRTVYIKARRQAERQAPKARTHTQKTHRRKYDGVKWGVRRMEDLLYELSVVGVFPPSAADAR